MIRAEGLRFGYGDAEVVGGLDAELLPGTATALVGRSGSGKSTLLYLLGLMLTPRGGEIVIDGAPTSTLRDHERAALRARLMGFIFQDALLDPSRTVLENVLEGVLYDDRASWRGADERALALLQQFGVDVDPRRRPGEISGGQAQRVALCRAFVGRPSIVFADEPTGNLDHETATMVWAALRARADEGAIVVVATHDRAAAERMDAVLEVSRAAAT